MHPVLRDFISEEKRSFKFKIGNALASALSGFIAGLIAAGIIWLAATYLPLVLQR